MDDIKPGWLTTEFWIAGLGVLFTALFGVLIVYQVVTQEEATAWLALLAAVTAVTVPVAIAAISRKYSETRAEVKSQFIEYQINIAQMGGNVGEVGDK